MIDLYLRAKSEAALIAVLPMFRVPAPPGIDIETGQMVPPSEPEVWQSASPLHALDAGIPVVEEPAVFDASGAVERKAKLKRGFHVNLRVDPQHPKLSAIITAIAPFVVSPEIPQRAFA